MDTKWLWAAVAVAAGFVVGGVVSKVVRSLLTRERQPEALKEAAGAIASLFFSIVLIIGLITALGIVNKESLETLPEDFVDYIPRALSAAIVIIIANVASTFVVAAVERSLGHVSATIRSRVPPVLRGSLLFAGGLIAANQLGVDTTILTLAAAALFFGIATSVALIVHAGSRQVSSEVAAGRALRRYLHPGDHIDTPSGAAGEIVELHAVSVELETGEGRRLLVPYSTLLDGVLGIERAEPDDEG